MYFLLSNKNTNINIVIFRDILTAYISKQKKSYYDHKPGSHSLMQSYLLIIYYFETFPFFSC